MPTAPHVDIKQEKKIPRRSPQSNTMNQCRVCLMEGFIPMNDYLIEMINYFTHIGVSQDDLLPKFLCESCHDLVLAAVLLRDIARESDFTLKNEPLKKKSTLNLTSTKNIARNLLQKLAQHSIIPSGVDIETKELNNDNVDDNDSEVHINEQSDLDVMSCSKCDADFLDLFSFKEHLAMHRSESHKDVVTTKQKDHSAIIFDEFKVLQHASNINSVIIPKLTELAYERKERIQIESMEYETDVHQKQEIVENLNKKLKQIAVLTNTINAETSPSNVNIKFTCMTNVSRKEDKSKIVKKPPQMVIYENKCFFVCKEVQDFHVHAHKHLINRNLEDKSAIENDITTDKTQTNSSQSDFNFNLEDIDSDSSTEQKSNTTIKKKYHLKVHDFANINKISAKRKHEDYSGKSTSTKDSPLLTGKTFVETEDVTEVFNCKECNDDCVGFSSYIDHLQTHLREKYPISKRKWTCNICMNDFKDKQYIHFILHMARHIACRVCNNEKNLEELKSAMETCLQHAKKVYNLNRRRNKILCENCGKSFPTADYRKHILSHKKEMRVQCKLCPFRTTRVGLLTSHMNCRHTEIRRFACDKCEKCFASSDKLSSHMKFAHSSKRYICTVERCKRKCITQAALNYHIQNEHMGGREWKCKYCDQKFHKRSGYWRHRVKVHKTTASFGRLPQYLRDDDKEK